MGQQDKDFLLVAEEVAHTHAQLLGHPPGWQTVEEVQLHQLPPFFVDVGKQVLHSLDVEMHLPPTLFQAEETEGLGSGSIAYRLHLYWLPPGSNRYGFGYLPLFLELGQFLLH